MCGPSTKPAPTPPPPPPPPPTPTAATPSATGLPDAGAYSQAMLGKKKGQSIRSQLRIQLGSGGTTNVGTGVNSNNS